MKPQDIKDQLTLEDVGRILESLGCEQVRIYGNMLSATKGGDSDNPNGVVIWDNGNFFNAEMYTTPEFEQYPVKDVFSVIRQISGCSFQEALDTVARFVEVDEVEQYEEQSMQSWLEKIGSWTGRAREKESLVYDNSFLDQFIPFLHPHWKDEGITEETAKKFDIRYDTSTECIIIPVLDDDGQLVGAKTRETKPAKNKYGYALRSRKSLVLYGLYQNKEAIREKKEVIVFEAEKSVLKADSLGVTNTVALGGKIISREQARLLKSLNVTIILALDEDVSDDDILKNVHTLAFPFPLYSVYVLRDDRLKAKESPADNPEVLFDYKNHLLKVV